MKFFFRHGVFAFVFGCAMIGLMKSHGEESDMFDRYGGLRSVSFSPAPFFRTHHDGDRWWLVTPDGNAFLSMGVNFLQFQGDVEKSSGRNLYGENATAKYGSKEKWAEATRERFVQWGLNTVAGWSGAELRDAYPYTIGFSFASPFWSKESVPDFFGPEFEQHARAQGSQAAQYANDPMLIGYFLDNELPWLTDHRFTPALFSSYLSLPPEAPGKQALVAFFKERYQTPEAFAKTWAVALSDWNALGDVRVLIAADARKAREDRDAFMLLAARQYFKLSTEAVRAADPNHLILGCRFIWATAPRAAAQACGEFCDVVSVNFYEMGLPGKVILSLYDRSVPRVSWDAAHFSGFYEAAHKPVMITEFSFRSMDSGMPNTYPPPWITQPNVRTQKERADKYQHYVSLWAGTPFWVGAHWFQYMDEPKTGRFDGENGNYGLVDITDEPYAGFIERFAEVNKNVWALHGAAAQ